MSYIWNSTSAEARKTFSRLNISIVSFIICFALTNYIYHGNSKQTPVSPSSEESTHNFSPIPEEVLLDHEATAPISTLITGLASRSKSELSLVDRPLILNPYYQYGWNEDERFSHFFEKKNDGTKNDGLIKTYARKTITPFIDIELKTKSITKVYESKTECFINGIFFNRNDKVARFMVGSETLYYDLDAFIVKIYDFETFFERGYESNDLIMAMANQKVITYDRRISHEKVKKLGNFENDPCFIVSIYPNQGEEGDYAQVIYKLNEENRGGYRLAWIYLNDVTEISYDDDYEGLYPIYAKTTDEIDLYENIALSKQKKEEHYISADTEVEILSIYNTRKGKIAYVSYVYNGKEVYAYCKLSHLSLPVNEYKQENEHKHVDNVKPA